MENDIEMQKVQGYAAESYTVLERDGEHSRHHHGNQCPMHAQHTIVRNRSNTPMNTPNGTDRCEPHGQCEQPYIAWMVRPFVSSGEKNGRVSYKKVPHPSEEGTSPSTAIGGRGDGFKQE